MRAIYKGQTNNLIAFIGDSKPVNVYRGRQLISNVSPKNVENTYQDGNAQYLSIYKQALNSLEMDGKAEQLTYQGYNYFDIDNVKLAARDSATFEFSPEVENGVLYSGGVSGVNAGAVAYIPDPQKSEDVYVSFQAEWDTGVTGCAVSLMRIANIGEDGIANYSVSKSLQLTTSGARYTFSGRIHSSYPYIGIAAQCSVKHGLRLRDVQISYADLAYEPYVGGVPSPNPLYPQPIDCVGKGGIEYFVANEDHSQSKVDIPGIELYSYTNPIDEQFSDGLTILRDTNGVSISSYKMMSKVNLADILDVDSVTDNGDGSFFVAIAGQFNPVLDKRYGATMGYCTHYNLMPNTEQDQVAPPNTLLLNSNFCLIISPTISVEEIKELISSRAVELVYVSIPSSIIYTDNDGQWVQQIGQLTYGHNPVIIISSKESDLAPDGTINYYIWEGNSNGN